MSFHATKLKQRFLIPFLLVSASIPAFSQAPVPGITLTSPEAITTTFVDPPMLAGNSGSGGDSKWLKIEFRYSITPTKGDYLDSVEFKVWVEGRDLLAPNAPGDEGIAVGLTGSVTYINLSVAKSKDGYGVFYIHPSTLARYSSKGGYTDFERKFNVHIQALVDGKDIDDADKNKEDDPAWFQKLTAVSGLVYRQDQSPFLLSDLGRYPAIKLPASSTDSSPAAPSPAPPPAVSPTVPPTQ
jgi:hypothetical protein